VRCGVQEQAESRVCITDSKLKALLPEVKELRILDLTLEREMIKKSTWHVANSRLVFAECAVGCGWVICSW
jgi:hypothetical protein